MFGKFTHIVQPSPTTKLRERCLVGFLLLFPFNSYSRLAATRFFALRKFPATNRLARCVYLLPLATAFDHFPARGPSIQQHHKGKHRLLTRVPSLCAIPNIPSFARPGVCLCCELLQLAILQVCLPVVPYRTYLYIQTPLPCLASSISSPHHAVHHEENEASNRKASK